MDASMRQRNVSSSQEEKGKDICLKNRDGWSIQLTQKNLKSEVIVLNKSGERIDHLTQFYIAPTDFTAEIQEVDVLVQEIKKLENSPAQTTGFWVHENEQLRNYQVVFGNLQQIEALRTQHYIFSAVYLGIAGWMAVETAPLWLMGGMLAMGSSLVQYAWKTPNHSYDDKQMLKGTLVAGAGSALGGRVAQSFSSLPPVHAYAANFFTNISLNLTETYFREGRVPTQREIKVISLSSLGGSTFQQLLSRAISREGDQLLTRLFKSSVSGAGGSMASTATINYSFGRPLDKGLGLSMAMGAYSAGLYDLRTYMESRDQMKKLEQQIEEETVKLREEAEQKFGSLVDEKMKQGFIPDDPELVGNREKIIQKLMQGEDVTFTHPEKPDETVQDRSFADARKKIDQDRKALETQKNTNHNQLEGQKKQCDQLKNEAQSLEKDWKDDVEFNRGAKLDSLLARSYTTEDFGSNREQILEQIAQGQQITFYKYNVGNSKYDRIQYKDAKDKYWRAVGAWKRYHQSHQSYLTALSQVEGVEKTLQGEFQKLEQREQSLFNSVEQQFGARVDELIRKGYSLTDSSINGNREAIIQELAKGEKLNFHKSGRSDVKLQDPSMKHSYQDIIKQKNALQAFKGDLIFNEKVQNLTPEDVERMKEEITRDQATIDRHHQQLINEAKEEYGAKIDEALSKGYYLTDQRLKTTEQIIEQLAIGERLHFKHHKKDGFTLGHGRSNRWSLMTTERRLEENLRLLAAYERMHPLASSASSSAKQQPVDWNDFTLEGRERMLEHQTAQLTIRGENLLARVVSDFSEQVNSLQAQGYKLSNQSLNGNIAAILEQLAKGEKLTFNKGHRKEVIEASYAKEEFNHIAFAESRLEQERLQLEKDRGLSQHSRETQIRNYDYSLRNAQSSFNSFLELAVNEALTLLSRGYKPCDTRNNTEEQIRDQLARGFKVTFRADGTEKSVQVHNYQERAGKVADCQRSYDLAVRSYEADFKQ